jgi:hypothetical protein
MKILTNLLLDLVAGNFTAGMIVQACHDHGSQTSTDPDWSELIASMDRRNRNRSAGRE